LPELSAPDWQRFCHQPAHRTRAGRNARWKTAGGRRARDDGSVQRIFRCPDCQVALFSQYGRPQVLFVRAGTLDDPTDITPDVHIFTRSKVKWVTLPPEAPAFAVYYDTNTLWPADSLKRLEAAVHTPQ
jgi:hypothetical protein